MKTKQALLLSGLLATTALCALPARADRIAVPKHAAFEEECGSCHIAYPPPLLPAASWRRLMDNLPRHFGSDASLEPGRRTAITEFLVNNAGGRKVAGAADASGQPALRISETAWFMREHREVDASTWRNPKVKSAANCAACHTQAAEGDYRERNIRIPR